VNNHSIFPNITDFCAARIAEFDTISIDRQEQLKVLSNYLSEQYQVKKTPQVIIICTHNSRRSHLGQLWLAVGADYLGLPLLSTFSGGTEATAFNTRAIAALKRVGFDIQTSDNSIVSNPKYQIKWSSETPFYTAFSKKYDTTPNPSSDFAAVMVCTDADANCPNILGMNLRIGLPFEDPKAFDDTNLEAQMYDERCQQIAREFLFVLQNVEL
jgi:arsenate reductase